MSGATSRSAGGAAPAPLLMLGEVARAAARRSDVVDVLMVLCERAVDLLPVVASGVLVGDGDGRLRTVASSGTSSALLALLDAHGADDASDATGAGAVGAGLGTLLSGVGATSAHAFPVAAGSTVVGRLSVFGDGSLGPAHVPLAEALADLAALTLLRTDAVPESSTFARRVHQALEGRAVVAQAVGILAERFTLDPDGALRRLRGAADGAQLGLVTLATTVVTGTGELPETLSRPSTARDRDAGRDLRDD